MDNAELQAQTGLTIYAHASCGEGYVWNGSAFVATLDAWADGKIDFTEAALTAGSGNETSRYTAELPTGWWPWHSYMIDGRVQAGESAAVDDLPAGALNYPARQLPPCIQTAINDASATTTGATLDFVDPIPDALVGWYLTLRSMGETVAISASTAAGHVTFASLAEAPADDTEITLRPPASR